MILLKILQKNLIIIKTILKKKKINIKIKLKN